MSSRWLIHGLRVLEFISELAWELATFFFCLLFCSESSLCVPFFSRTVLLLLFHVVQVFVTRNGRFVPLWQLLWHSIAARRIFFAPNASIAIGSDFFHFAGGIESPFETCPQDDFFG